MMKLKMARELQAGDSVCRGAASKYCGGTRLRHPVDDLVGPLEALQKKRVSARIAQFETLIDLTICL